MAGSPRGSSVVPPPREIVNDALATGVEVSPHRSHRFPGRWYRPV